MLRTLAVQSRLAFSSARWFSVSAISRADQQTFEEASKLVNTLSEEPGNDVKLKLYGLYKQSTEGACTKGKPGAMDFIGRAKWEAWKSLGSISKEQARDQYVELVHKLAGKAVPASASAEKKAEKTAEVKVKSSVEGDIVSRLDDRGVLYLTMSRPAKNNALTMKMYSKFGEELERAAQDDRVLMTVIRGDGNYFTSGNDLANFATAIGETGSLEEAIKSRFPIIRRLIYAFIEHPKTLIAAVNGPAVGIGATLLAHCDFVYAAKSAWIHTPFLHLGLLPENCSSYLFLRALGPTLAKRMLILGEKMPVQKLEHTGFISECVDDAELDAYVEKRVAELAKMPKFSLHLSKQLCRQPDMSEMRRIVELEFQAILEGIKRPEVIGKAINAYTELMKKKSN